MSLLDTERQMQREGAPQGRARQAKRSFGARQARSKEYDIQQIDLQKELFPIRTFNFDFFHCTVEFDGPSF